MDCEKFDRIVLDLLYDELDDITGAAGRRHMEHCVRCKDIGARLRATRELSVLPLVDPPASLAQRIIEAEQRVRRQLPARQRFGRAVSVLAGYAMRPQLAMAALLLLVIGSSLLLVRTRPGEQKNVLVTERGVPEAEPEGAGLVPLAAQAPRAARLAPTPSSTVDSDGEKSSARASATASSKGDSAASRVESAESQRAVEADRAYEQALGAYRDRKYEEAEQRFTQIAARGGDNAASAALYAAQSARASGGCGRAVAQFDEVFRRFPDAPPGREAAWQAAGCYRTMGDFDHARREYEALLNTPGYADRAQAALASLGDAESTPAQMSLRAAAPSEAKGSLKAASPAATRPLDPARAPAARVPNDLDSPRR